MLIMQIQKNYASSYLGFDVTILDSHFGIPVKVFMNQILAENTYFMNHVD